MLELHLRRIERYNPTLNAIVTPNYDAARRVAAAADEARARGEDRPLLGLPLTVAVKLRPCGVTDSQEFGGFYRPPGYDMD